MFVWALYLQSAESRLEVINKGCFHARECVTFLMPLFSINAVLIDAASSVSSAREYTINLSQIWPWEYLSCSALGVGLS